ncbi:Predicted membrane protein [Nocardia otitidiscaviarum]|uniref:Predicted membrane protein n=1 Tax=Nocardia otitidiscaviarum TaxID=1823 RepID=A0A378YX94_9NOCA|nr:YoaK family protein [Nocardia otitidiscaviarum]SUA81051.1 Predicted membrane protein [Nocardia otitidiscaviarum]
MAIEQGSRIGFPGGPTALVLLSAGAGATDALVFTELGKVFASVLTGNLVLLGVAAALPWTDVAGPLTVLGGYAVGVVVAARWCRAERGRRERRVLECLVAEAVLVGALAALAVVCGDGFGRAPLLVLASLAMGMQSATVMAADPNSPTTYLTSTFTRFCSDLAATGKADPWSPARIAGLVVGAGGAVALGRATGWWAFLVPAALIVAALVCVGRGVRAAVST